MSIANDITLQASTHRVNEFIGGVRFSSPVGMRLGANATWPLARLALDETKLVLSLRGQLNSSLFAWFGFPTIEIPYDELLAVEVVPGGLRFHTQTKTERGRQWDRRNGAIFGCGPRKGNLILDLLEARGVPIGAPEGQSSDS